MQHSELVAYRAPLAFCTEEAIWVAPEETLEAWVAQRAREFGWARYHTHDSRRSPEGFPDDVLSRDEPRPRWIVAELKSMDGQPTPEQRRWLDLWASNGSVEVYLWRPCHWAEIVRILNPGYDPAVHGPSPSRWTEVRGVRSFGRPRRPRGMAPRRRRRRVA